MLLPLNPSAFRRALLAWFAKHGRDLPWRRTHDAYAILVSEFMLQQTQVATVIPYYREWLRRFPDVATLAAAPESDVLHAWQGLGYYARSRNLHATAKIIAEQHGGEFPRDASVAGKLPGLGRYTANAVSTFAFDAALPIVETNIARVLSRLFNVRLPIDSTAGRNALWKTAAALIPQKRAGTYNSALMDLGAAICTARAPKCNICPVRDYCLAPDPANLPVKQPCRAVQLLTEDHAFVRSAGKILLEQSEERWRGLWIVPRLIGAAPDREPIYTAEFPFTHHRITLRVFRRAMEKSTARCWFQIRELKSLAIPSPHRRALEALLRNSTLDVRRSAFDVCR